jgi:hypothetical protein
MAFKSEAQRRAVMARLAYARQVKQDKKSRRFTMPSGQQQHITGLPGGTFNPKNYRKVYHRHRAATKRRVDYFNVQGRMVPRIPNEIFRERIQAVARYHYKKGPPVTSMTDKELKKDLYERGFAAHKEYSRTYMPGRKKFRPGTAVRVAVKARLKELRETQAV